MRKTSSRLEGVLPLLPPPTSNASCVGITRLCSAADGSWTGSDRIFCSISIYGSVWNCLAKVQDFALTIYPIFTYFTCYQVEIHGPPRSSDVLGVTFACKREYFLHLVPNPPSSCPPTLVEGTASNGGWGNDGNDVPSSGTIGKRVGKRVWTAGVGLMWWETWTSV